MICTMECIMQISVQHVNSATNNDTVSHPVEVYCIQMQPETHKDT